MYFVTVFSWYILLGDLTFSTKQIFQKFSAVIISKFFCISDLNSCWISWRILMPSAFCKIPNRKNWKIQVLLKIIRCFVKLIRISYHQLFRSILETASEFIGIPFVKQNRLLLFYWILEFRWRLLAFFWNSSTWMVGADGSRILSFPKPSKNSDNIDFDLSH